MQLTRSSSLIILHINLCLIFGIHCPVHAVFCLFVYLFVFVVVVWFGLGFGGLGFFFLIIGSSEDWRSNKFSFLTDTHWNVWTEGQANNFCHLGPERYTIGNATGTQSQEIFQTWKPFFPPTSKLSFFSSYSVLSCYRQNGSFVLTWLHFLFSLFTELYHFKTFAFPWVTFTFQ